MVSFSYNSLQIRYYSSEKKEKGHILPLYSSAEKEMKAIVGPYFNLGL